ncbi:nucleotide-binding protein [Tabrizicola sp. WMC-M-20]|nr:nucleotide-binding protein [Tabrizicola sp. WMC-M-20]
MRHFVTFFSAASIALLTTSFAFAQTISPQDAAQHIGASMTVEGVVAQVSVSGGGTTFINFGGRYPDHVFYGVIFTSNAEDFPNVESLEGRSVALTGTVDLYKGKPQIILNSPDQIELRD